MSVGHKNLPGKREAKLGSHLKPLRNSSKQTLPESGGFISTSLISVSVKLEDRRVGLLRDLLELVVANHIGDKRRC